MGLPPAKLYLDDIEEIVDLFSRALPAHQDSAGGVPPIEKTFEIGQKQCNRIDDLASIALRTAELKIEVRREYSSLSLTLDRTHSWWMPFDLSKEEAWGTARKLQSIFEQRRMLLGQFAHKLWLVPPLLGTLFPAIQLLPGSTAKAAAAISYLVLLVIWGLGFRRHSLVICRHRAAELAGHHERKEKLLIVLFTAVISIFGTLAVQYAIHKLWPWVSMNNPRRRSCSQRPRADCLISSSGSRRTSSKSFFVAVERMELNGRGRLCVPTFPLRRASD